MKLSKLLVAVAALSGLQGVFAQESVYLQRARGANHQ